MSQQKESTKSSSLADLKKEVEGLKQAVANQSNPSAELQQQVDAVARLVQSLS